MKTITAHAMRELDRRAIEDIRIPSIVLMENAGIRTVDYILARHGRRRRLPAVLIVCGPGNNGGDGLVIARHLINKGYDVTTFVLTQKSRVKGDSLINLTVLEHMGGRIFFAHEEKPDNNFTHAIDQCGLIVDAIFGTGLDRAVIEPIKTFITLMNRAEKEIIAVDAPSGINCESGEVLGVAVRAQYTVTMAVAKKGFFIGAAPEYVGELAVVDISIPRKMIEAI